MLDGPVMAGNDYINAMVGGYAQNGHGEEVVKLWHQINSTSILSGGLVQEDVILIEFAKLAGRTFRVLNLKSEWFKLLMYQFLLEVARTALHYATQVKDAEVALGISQSLFNKYDKRSNKRSLKLWASAAGIGSAEESKGIDPSVKDFLLEEKKRDDNHLLYVDMAWELLHRSAYIEDTGGQQSRSSAIQVLNPPCWNSIATGETMSTPTKLRFKIIDKDSLMPNGYRLATVKEVGNNLEAIKRQDWKGYTSRLLDGQISSDYRVDTTLHFCFCCLVVKEKVWDEETRGWKKKCSACYPSSGNLLRTQLYDEIDLSEQERKIAQCLAAIRDDAEVICWLLKTTNSEREFRGFQNLFSLKEMKEWSSMRNSYDVVKCLCASKFPLQLPLEEDDRRNTVLDYLIYFIEFYGTPFSTIQWIELLIELYSTNIVHHYKIRDGVSFLDKVTSKAIVESKAIVASMSEDMIYKNRSFVAFTKLLSVSSNSVENQVSKMKHCFGDVLIEAVERGYAQLVDALLEFKDSIDQLPTDVFLKIAQEAIGKGYSKCLENMLNLLKLKVGNELQQDKYGKTLFHYAAKSENEEVSGLLSRAYLEEYRVKKRDKWGRTFLHWAALTGQAYLCSTVCIGELKLKVDAKDNLGQNALHLAAKGIRGHLVVDILLKSSSANLVYATDGEGRTPLHFASAKGNIKMVEKLLENTREEKMFQQPDGFGKTALQMAAQGGHTRIVQRLLEQVSDPFLHRDAHGSTALHYATGVQDAEVALAISQSLLNKYKGGDDNRSLMLWASAAGIGTAEEREGVNPLVKDFLLQEKAGDENHLLKAAALTENVDMAWELLHRGADIADIKPSNKPWDRERDEKRIRVIKEIEIANEQGQDKPSSVDNLGRNVFAEGLAALFLNKYVESPITVGICGEWGMGKSSVMVQTENILLMAASQLSFPNLLPFENFGGAKKTLLTSEDQLRMIAFVDDLDRCDEKVIIQVLSAINLVLAECKINVILGIDKKMIQRAVETHFEDNDDRDLADKFICKIIQIPLSLPDLVVEESDKFLQRHLGHPPPTKTIIRVDDEDTDYGEIDTDNDDTSQRQESTSVEIDSSNRLQTDDIKKSNKSLGKESHVVEINFCKRLQTSCQGIIQKVSHWLACLFQSFFLLACNLTSEIQTMQDEMNKSEIRPLAFSKGARLTREMLLSKYSPKEAETLHKFKEFATGTQKLPREWKRFLDYRKIACNILSMRGKVYKLPSWRVELVAWVFVCWQWKHEINTLIKGWHKYAHVKGKDKRKIVEAEDEENRNLFGPSLKQIVKNYVMELNESQKKIDGEVYLDRYRDSRTIETQGGLME
ncbi:hypothetical protein SUGI_0025690 [Cryptomeria japonica]|nr:hypothetical protein SUGI_0025690 [Cryptomeria japonica]